MCFPSLDNSFESLLFSSRTSHDEKQPPSAAVFGVFFLYVIEFEESSPSSVMTQRAARTCFSQRRPPLNPFAASAVRASVCRSSQADGAPRVSRQLLFRANGFDLGRRQICLHASLKGGRVREVGGGVVEGGGGIDDEHPQSASERVSRFTPPAAAVLSSLKSGFTTAELSPSASI